jgi:iron complex outermembrane receptor protein
VLTLNQRELVSSAGAFLSDELFLMPRLRMSGGVRGDNVSFEVRDRLITANNPDDSGRRSLHAVTPYLGLNARLNEDHSLYGNISSAFETPTATELGNHPDGSAGINQDLKPQRSTTYEVGLKGGAFERMSYDLATFVTKARDELVPFEIPSSGGRRYFRNAGRTTRRGAEVAAGIAAGHLLFNAAYTYSDFRFDRYATSTVVFDGKRIPGIPMNRVQASVTLNSRAGFLVTETEIAGPAFVDDANTLRAPGFEVMHVRAGSDHLFGSPYFSVVAGIQNVFNRAYSPSISINAAAGKFFEPAPLRTFYVGLSIRISAK